MISVIIPIKDEPYAQKLVNDIKKRLPRTEIIIVDKSSKPQTLKNAKVIRQQSKGLGKAVLEGIEHAKGDIIVTMDGDGSHDPKHIPAMTEELKKNDIVIGSRFVRGGKTLDKTHRKFVSWCFRELSSMLLGLSIKDTMSGFSATRRSVYEKLKPNPIGYKINLECMYRGKKQGLRIREVPIIFKPRQNGKSKAGVPEALRTLLFIIKLRFSR